ncbi:ribonuclease H-like YkuK family protein [Clostridium sp. SHJSY1]|uniref:ribonuclease H-like YkuK family protein n=1 Tax=Clostridium sp. SHJSY1 TaxID=2942483 RepID=UPI002874AD3A|nr:ribonuclease H-like YkuK family protein [Clostridium sp. SHJSY1]MDS0526604.1 ribonuclease H-like YkuK family protein [Clostridium sp. SHJSY1]
MKSLTYGEVNFDCMFELIRKYVNEKPEYEYKISVGTDSQNFDLTKVVIVVAINRVGKGGIFFYDVKRVKKITNIHQKIFCETDLSLNLATKISEKFHKEHFDYNIDIHVDAGERGDSSKLIPEITAWINSLGFDCKTKPYSYVASSIANRYSK